MPHISLDVATAPTDLEIRLHDLPADDPIEMFVKGMVSSRFTAAKQAWVCHVREFKGFREYLDAVGFADRDASEEAIERILCWTGLSELDFKVKSGEFDSDLEPRLLQSVRTTLYGDQITGVRFLVSKHRALLADSMGIGKTLQAIATYAVLKEMKAAQRAIVVAIDATKSGWEKEVRKHGNGLTCTVLPNGRDKILEAIAKYREKPTDFLVIQYEGISAMPRKKAHGGASHQRELSNPIVEALLECPFDVVYSDEAHLLKNMGTRRYKCFQYFLSQVKTSEPQVEVEYLTESGEHIKRTLSSGAAAFLEIGETVDVL